ncbi:MAG: FecR domain-containing protein [Pseudomonadota bacterium]
MTSSLAVVRLACLLASVWAWAGLGLAQAQILETRQMPIVADVVDVKGEEDFTPVELGDWRDVALGQDLSAGDLLRTGAFGGLGIAFEDRTYIRLHANSRMAVADPGTAGGPRRLQLDAGRLWSRASRPEQGVIIETPTATAAIRGTDWFMEVASDGTSRLVVLDGEVRFFNDLGELQVNAGAAAVARPGQAPEFELLVISQDRPRWAITPRSDWVTFLPITEVANGTSTEMAPIWSALAAERPREAMEMLLAAGPRNSASAALASALANLMQRQAQAAEAALTALPRNDLSPAERRLADAGAIGAAIDLARFPTAVERLGVYRASHGEDITSLALSAFLEAYAGRYKEARTLANVAPISAPDDWRAPLLIAQIATLQGDDAASATQTLQAVTLAPEAAPAWHWRALYLSAAGSADPLEIQSALQRATALNPERVVSVAALAQVKAAQGHLQDALALYNTALALDPTEPFAIAGKAFVHLTMGRLDLADATLSPFADSPLVSHPEVQSVLAIRDLMTGEPDAASLAAGRVIAASPNRPGIAQLEAISHWQANRHGVALNVIENAVRLDPNNPVSARIASAMAQDQYRADAAIVYARSAWDAKRRNAAAGLVQLPASQSGRIDIGGAFQYAGLPAQGEYYSSLALAQADANSAFGYAQLFPNGVARQSSTSIGLLLDPLSVTYPNRFATFFRAPMTQQTLDASVSIGADGASRYQLTSDTQRFIRTPDQPIAVAGFLTLAEDTGPVDHDTRQSALLSLRGGTVRDGQHSFIGRLTLDYQDAELPGAFGNIDRDDTEETLNTVAELGYVFSHSFTDRLMLRMTGGSARRAFRNPSAFGSGLDPLDYSLAVSLGLQNAQDLASRDLFDTTLSEPNAFILAVDAPASFPTTDQVGIGLLSIQDDLDPVSRISSDATLISLQARQILSRGEGDFSIGLEYGRTEAETRISELALSVTGAGAVADFGAGGVAIPFDLGVAAPLSTATDADRSALQGHALGTWETSAGMVIEAGLFPVWIEEDFSVRGIEASLSDETLSADPRIGLALRGARSQLRFALQRTRLLPGVDSIAPIGTLGLLPTENIGVTSERTDSAILRLEGEVTERVFLHATLEHQDLQNASTGLAGERLDQAAFFASNAKSTRMALGADIRLEDRLAVTALYAVNRGEIDGGAFDGADLPVIPEQSARLGLTWVDPRFFRAEASLSYLGERSADAGNLLKLDEAFVLAGGIAFETQDKSWQLRLDGQLVSSDDNPTRLGQPASDSRLTIGLSRRW